MHTKIFLRGISLFFDFLSFTTVYADFRTRIKQNNSAKKFCLLKEGKNHQQKYVYKTIATLLNLQLEDNINLEQVSLGEKTVKMDASEALHIAEELMKFA